MPSAQTVGLVPGQLSWCVFFFQVMPVGMMRMLQLFCSPTAHPQQRADYKMGTAGTARCREAVSKLSEHYDVVVNIQVSFLLLLHAK